MDTVCCPALEACYRSKLINATQVLFERGEGIIRNPSESMLADVLLSCRNLKIIQAIECVAQLSCGSSLRSHWKVS